MTEHRERTAGALLAALGLAWSFFGVSSVALGRPRIALIHLVAVFAVSALWLSTRRGVSQVARRAHGGAAITVFALAGIAMYTLQGDSLACWYLLLVPLFVVQVAGWRAVLGWTVVGLATAALVRLSERFVTVEPEHIFTALETQVGALVMTSAALAYAAYARHIAENQLDAAERSRRKILEQAEELARVHQELAGMHEHALSESTAKSRLMARVSHEIRTPLNGLLGLSELLSDAPLDPVHLDMVRSLHASASALRQLVDDLLDVTRIQEGRVTLNVEAIDVRELIGDVVDTFAVLAQKKGVELVGNVDAKVPTRVSVDGIRLRQVTSNLVGNALKFTDRGEVVIHVSGEIVDDVFEGRVEVRDTGPGIDPSSLPGLFEAFEQAEDPLPVKRQGTGLGLWISRELSRALGGELGATSEPGEGSTFFFTFQGIAIAGTGRDSSGMLLLGARVLLIDPHAASRDAMTHLAGAAGYELTAEAGLDDALAHVKGKRVDIIIIDSGAAPSPLRLRDEIAAHAPDARFVLARPAAALSDPRPRGFAAVTMKPYRASRLASVLMDVLPQEPSVSPATAAPRMGCLVVDDDETNRMVARLLLEKAGQKVIVAKDTKEAEAILGAVDIDVVFQDVHMPEEDGISFVKRLRESFDSVPPMWIVALTAAATKSERASFIEAGMDDFLAKPIELGLLRAVVERAYRATRRRKRKTSVAGIATIDHAIFDELTSNLEDEIVPISQEFADSSEQHVAAMREGLALGDIAVAHRAMHTLASSSALLGATTLARLSLALEAELADGKSPSPEVVDALAVCRDQSVQLIHMRVKLAYPDP